MLQVSVIMLSRNLLRQALFCCTLLLMVPAGAQGEDVSYYFSALRLDMKTEKPRIAEAVKRINERNRTVEKDPGWLRQAYAGLQIRSLRDIPPEEYSSFRQYLDAEGSQLYIIVHPAWALFFSEEPVSVASAGDIGGMPSRNMVERFFEQGSLFNDALRLMQAQELAERDFLEVMSTEKKLVILVLPPGYAQHFTYGFSKGLDEYARYLNEVTNGAESVLFIESKNYNEGTVSSRDLGLLGDFIKALDPKYVVVGGGFVGRCLELFYQSMLFRVDRKLIHMAPEITAISPLDIDDQGSGGLLTKEGKIKVKSLRARRHDEISSLGQRKQIFVYIVGADGTVR